MGGIGISRSARDAMRELRPNVLVTSVIEPLTWDSAMEIVRGNECVADISNNPHTQYLINNACPMVEMETKKATTTNSVSGRGGDPIPLVSGSAMGTEGKITVYKHNGGYRHQ